jgi:hypothetical protein
MKKGPVMADTVDKVGNSDFINSICTKQSYSPFCQTSAYGGQADMAVGGTNRVSNNATPATK